LHQALQHAEQAAAYATIHGQCNSLQMSWPYSAARHTPNGVGRAETLALLIQHHPEPLHTCELHIPVAVPGQEAVARSIPEPQL
jgi:hypothetical protein